MRRPPWPAKSAKRCWSAAAFETPARQRSFRPRRIQPALMPPPPVSALAIYRGPFFRAQSDTAPERAERRIPIVRVFC